MPESKKLLMGTWPGTTALHSFLRAALRPGSLSEKPKRLAFQIPERDCDHVMQLNFSYGHGKVKTEPLPTVSISRCMFVYPM